MPLKIIKASEVIRVERLNVVIYAQPGIGKSTMAFTADAPLLLDFDNGAHRALNRKDVVRVASWREVADISGDDLVGYKTVIVDTAGRALDVLTTDIIKRNPKASKGAGALTLPGFGQLKSEFIAWLKAINAHGLDVVLIVHMDESRNGDEIIERLDITGGSKAEIYKAADAMGRIQMVEGKRVLNFNPSDTAFGKNPGQLDPMLVPHPDKDPAFLAFVIAAHKAKLNQMTAEQTAAVSLVEDWREKVQTYHTLQAFNSAIPEVRATRNKAVLSFFETAAATAGFIFSRETKLFVFGPRLVGADAPEAPKTAPTFGDATPIEPEPDAPGEGQPVEQEALL